MHDYPLMRVRSDQETVPVQRLDYTDILDKLILSSRMDPGGWMLIAYARDTQVPKRLKRAALTHEDMEWGWTVETFSRRMRPNKNGSPGYEIWARIKK